MPAARKAFMSWSKPQDIIPRRKAERDLFFDGKWSNDGKATEYTKVTKSGNIVWSSAKRVRLPAMHNALVQKSSTPKPTPKQTPLAAFLAAIAAIFKGK